MTGCEVCDGLGYMLIAKVVNGRADWFDAKVRDCPGCFWRELTGD